MTLPTSSEINQSFAVVKLYTLTGGVAMFVLYVDVSNDGPFRHVDDELTVAGLSRIKLDFEDG